jgi:drug/metabolite transporter, DME family
MSDRTARAQLLLAALLFSTGGAVIKATTLTSWQVASGRSFFAAIIILIGGKDVLKGFSWRAAVVGAAQAATLITFVTANKLTTAANAVFLQATAPLYVALLGPFLLGERFKRRDIPVLILIAAGVGLLFAGSPEPVATAPRPVLGTVIGVASGFCWSLTVMGLRWLSRSDPEGNGSGSRAAAVIGSLIAFVACGPFAWPWPTPTVADVAGVAYLGIFQVGVAYLLLSYGLRHVPAAAASLLLLAEPAFSPLWAWVFHHEAPGFWPLVGGAMILGAATAATLRNSRTAD